MQRAHTVILALVVSMLAATDAPADEAAGQAPPLTIDEIIANNVEARGGLEAWRAVNTVRMKGTMELGNGATAPLTLEFKRPSKVRVEFEVEGRKGSQAYDGETAWAVVSFAEQEPIRLSPEQSQDLVQQADFEGPLIGYREKGNAVRLAGTAEVDGRKVYEVEVERSGGETTIHQIDAETFLEVGHAIQRSFQGQEIEISVRLGDYRKVGKLLIPFRVEQAVSIAPAPQVIQLESVEVDVDLPDERFAFPEDGSGE